MSSIIENKDRIGSFTSSEIYRLMGYGEREMTPEELAQWKKLNPKSRKKNITCIDTFDSKGLNYIDEKKIELRAGRCISTDVHSQAMAWGNFMEQFVFAKIGLEWQIKALETKKHPKIKHWSGSNDLLSAGKKIGEIKCYQPLNFFRYTDAILTQDIQVLKNDFEKEYWQLVSNAIINEVPRAEAISFMPYLSELKEIREMAQEYQGDDQWKYRFIHESPDYALPYVVDGGYYKDLNSFEFEVPKEDIEALTTRVKMAVELLKAK